jgi:formate dehydrogenase maturation protein FdhE
MLRHYLELPSARQLAAAAIGDRAQDVRKEAIALLDHHAWPAEQLSRYLNQILSGSPTDEDLAQLKATVAGSSTRALAELSERIDALIARRAAVSGANQRPSGR